MRLPAALIACAPSQFAARPIEMRAALAVVTDASEVLSRLPAGAHGWRVPSATSAATRLPTTSSQACGRRVHA